MRSEVIIFLAIGVLLAPSAGLTQEADLVSETIRESVQERTKSSGSVFRGIHYGPLDVRPDLSALSVVLPPGTERRLCLTIESQDGQYFGEASYLIPSRRSASARTVRLATKYRPIIESFA
ncbi:MAG TPA: hypothetical protein VM818_20635, partial [Vicinamibacterales bacterium]|nr:hypothetical protein [Vicinamibacterales bacterium]